jgi:hypothetical protein
LAQAGMPPVEQIEAEGVRKFYKPRSLKRLQHCSSIALCLARSVPLPFLTSEAGGARFGA